MQSAPKGTLAGFVSTSVLTSSDGLFGDHVEETRISDAPAAPEATSGDFKPLYERLQELKEKKDLEWKEKNNPFAPPKALDDEELEFIRDLESKQANSQKKRKEQHEEDLVSFALARESLNHKSPAATASVNAKTADPPVIRNDAVAKTIKAKKPPVVALRAKRKAGDKQASTAATSTDKKQKISDDSKEKKSTEEPKPALMGLVAYGSDSDDLED